MLVQSGAGTIAVAVILCTITTIVPVPVALSTVVTIEQNYSGSVALESGHCPVSGHSGKSWPAIVIYFRSVVLKYYTGGVEMK